MRSGISDNKKMFSLFRSKKSPRASPEPIPGPDASPPESDNFVIVEDRNPSQPNPQSQTGLYPLFDSTSNSRSEAQNQPVHYLQGVPFKISPDLSEGDATQAFQVQVDEILAKLTRWNSIEEDYDFMLERSLVAQ